MTRSKAKATDIDVNQGAASKVNPTKVLYNKRQGNATPAVKKKEGKGSKKLPSNSENSVSASLSPLPTPLVSDANSSTGLHSGSSLSSPKRLESLIHSDASYSMAMQAMATDAATVEEQLATMARAIEKLTKIVEDKDLQIASFMNKLEAQNMEGTSHDASHPLGFTPKGVIIANQSGKLMMGDQTGKLKQIDDGNHVLSSNQGDGHSPTSGSKAKGEHVATPTEGAIARTLQFGSLEPVMVQVLSQEISTSSCVNKNPSAEIDEGWIVVTRKKSCKNKLKAKPVCPTKTQGKRNHHQYAKRKGGRKIKAMKEVLEVCEPVEQNPLAPITLRDFFPKGYFKEDEVEAIYMASTSEEIDGDIEQPHALKAAMNKEEADLLTTLNEAPLRFSLREASQLSQSARLALIQTGLGFTPPKPIRISAKGKGKKVDVQHITAEEVKEDDNEQVAPRVSVFDRIEAPIPQTSVFNRLGVTKETCEGATLQPKKSIFSRLGNRSTSSREHNSEREGKSIELDSAKEDEETRSSIPSRMKRITSLEVNTEGPLKVKRRTIVLTGQPKGNEIAEKEEEMAYTTSYHVAVEEHSSSDSEDDDFPEAPLELEDGGQPTVDDLKELNLGTFDEPRPIFCKKVRMSTSMCANNGYYHNCWTAASKKQMQSQSCPLKTTIGDNP
ncbi:hypothetical protein RHGRI_029682 [Rhododendron griersonianum]|uniref:Uncharacterized protein n=1 Tax=Rhododendron griersonianum TaxID=479676 RepID=A0AAV6INH5_9ERIC|nr:hypothetical protein RHGRI_029682 [Rhododendron griersonianum]